MLCTKINTIEFNELGLPVYSGRIARSLLRQGYIIIDIKPNKADKKLSVFIFKIERNLHEEIEKLIQHKI